MSITWPSKDDLSPEPIWAKLAFLSFMGLDNLTKLCPRGSPLTPPCTSPPTHTPTGVPPRCLRGLRSRTSGVPDRRSDGTMSVGPYLRLVAGVGDTFHPFPGPAPSLPARGPAGGPGLIPGNQPATARPRVNILVGSQWNEILRPRLDTRAPGHEPTTRRGERTAR